MHERESSVTRPTSGIDWKRDVKAGFTGAILLGRVNRTQAP